MPGVYDVKLYVFLHEINLMIFYHAYHSSTKTQCSFVWFNGITNQCKCVVENRGTQGSALVENPARDAQP